MGRQDRFRHDQGFLEGVLNEAEDIMLAFCDGDNAPYVIPVNHVLIGKALYFHTDLAGRKMDLIRKNPRVGFSTAVDARIIPEKSTTSFRSICGTGTASIVEGMDEKRTALDGISLRFQSRCPRPAPEAMLNRVAIVRIDIETLVGKYAPGETEALKDS